MVSNFIYYLGAFALALGLLISVHEFGHFLVARLCGIKVLRFSLGFGKTLLSRQFGSDRTEWAIAVFPLGGYVKMLDEREGPVEPHELSRAFNRQTVWKRILVVVAGPLANLLLAVLLYWVLFMQGVDELRPILATAPANTVAAAAEIQDGETVRNINGKAIVSWQELRWELLQAAVNRATVTLETINRHQEISFRKIDTSRLEASDLESDLAAKLGLLLYRPAFKPVIGMVTPGSVAERAGLRAGDEFVAIDNRPVKSWADVTTTIRQSPGQSLNLRVKRNKLVNASGSFGIVEIRLTPAEIEEGGRKIGRIGIAVRDDPATRAELVINIRYTGLPAFGKAVTQTWDTSIFSLKMIGRMLTGNISWKNLSGPVTIADYAGQSAQLGLSYYLKFLALISISLGVLNLLPIPILDGGHLLYYIVEIIKGSPLSEKTMEIGQQIGLFLLVMLMVFAFYNDINRLVSG